MWCKNSIIFHYYWPPSMSERTFSIFYDICEFSDDSTCYNMRHILHMVLKVNNETLTWKIPRIFPLFCLSSLCDFFFLVETLYRHRKRYFNCHCIFACQLILLNLLLVFFIFWFSELCKLLKPACDRFCSDRRWVHRPRSDNPHICAVLVLSLKDQQ